MSSTESYILIVEDSKVLLDILVNWVRETFPGKPVLGVSSVADANEAIAALKIDFFLVDFVLPDGSGLDLMMDVKTVWPDAQFAMMSLDMPEHDRASMLALKPAAFFRKPIDFGQLEWVLKTYLKDNEHGSARLAEGGFRTTLHAVTVHELIQLNCMEGATCALEFRNITAEVGYVYFAKGEIIHAETQDTLGIEALSQIIGWKNGVAKQLSRWVPPETTTIGPPWQGALMEAAQIADENQHNASSQNRQAP